MDIVIVRIRISFFRPIIVRVELNQEQNKARAIIVRSELFDLIIIIIKLICICKKTYSQTHQAKHHISWLEEEIFEVRISLANVNVWQ